jgi:prepilin peptidase CpaA
MQTTVILLALGTLITIGYGDVRTRRIPNVLVGAIVALGLARITSAGDMTAASNTLIATAVVFAIGLLLFWGDVLGGGDAKLLAAMALLVGSQDLFCFLFFMSMCGGILALAILIRDKLRTGHWQLLRYSRTPPATCNSEDFTEPIRSTVPYGVAITAAGVFVLILHPYF